MTNLARRFNFYLSQDISDFIRGYACKYDISYTDTVSRAILLLADKEKDSATTNAIAG